MRQRDVAVVMVGVAATLLCCRGQDQAMKTATACYGTVNNYLRLECNEGYVIHVLRVIYGVKVKSAMCPSPASLNNYRRECCGFQMTDCWFKLPDGSGSQCENNTSCMVVATWATTNKECDQDEFPGQTNYMRMEYMCRRIEVTREISATTVSSTSSSLLPTSSKPSTAVSTPPPATVSTPPAKKVSIPPTTLTIPPSTTASIPLQTTTTAATVTSAESTLEGNMTTVSGSPPVETLAPALATDSQAPTENEMSTVMIGALVGGCLGMLLTFVIFMFYWGSKRRLRIVGKPQPTVWDYLLSQTFTVRGTKGYNYFSSLRSLASSGGDPGSPNVRKNIWLPNIVDKSGDSQDEIISNYNNEVDKYHRVEIHEHATPSPYAILNLNYTRQENNLDV